jgi:hypothetical protein
MSKSLVRWGEAAKAEGKDYLIKNNMSGDDNVAGGEIETPIAFVISRVSDQDTTSGTWANLWAACVKRLG